ncbi:MAG: hypothetical protein ORO03_04460 [Alphaproteobacteria bacterium]|nr:hypothetical protein [Alphaproteobacteria bacterium]
MERPNRKEPRLFTVKDLERLAKYVARDSGLGVWKILFAIAGALGLGAFLCRLVRAIKRFGLILDAIQWISAGVVLVKALEIFATWVLRSPISAIPIVRTIALAIAVLALVLSKLIKAAGDAISDIAFMNDAVAALQEGCEYIGERIEDVGDLELPDLPDLPDLSNIPNPLE